MSVLIPSLPDKAFNEQITLFSGPPNILKKPIQATHIIVRNGVMTGMQKKAFDFLLKKAKDSMEKQREEAGSNLKYPIEFSVNRLQLMNYMGYQGSNRKPFKDALKKMQTLTVEWDVLHNDKNFSWESCVLLPWIKIDSDMVFYSFTPHIQPMLFQNTLYSKLNLHIQGLLSTDPGIKLYDWVNRYRDIKFSNKETWQFWRTVLHGEVDDKSYLNQYKIFKRIKLVPAINEINQISDISIELIEDTNGSRMVQFLQFKIDVKPQFKIEDDMTKSPFTVHDLNLEFEELGITRHYATKLRKQFPINRILANIEYLKQRLNSNSTPITNRGAYLFAACSNDYASVNNAIETKVDEPSVDVSAEGIVQAFNKQRVDDAINMFKEMDIADQEKEIQIYNETLLNKAAAVPDESGSRQNRQMIPFFKWLAEKTWGEPTPEELIKFTLLLK
ncbi:replication initiation protein [Undibacterium oligocarboniphilum]|uniref:Replication initiation protein n=1 Tax=Undibacterium oligocarboniphilum TaxID=666702 RepID=A0A850QQG4_9BURK|nr:replication initiation protein [Undibacterium oligocarboniphilum]MBC3871404.1 replication initiation protein [Undibacterium oligocarboniphilum]NVO79020.1 replication initiation protein [Undibacterium oligocarboniphilum]